MTVPVAFVDLGAQHAEIRTDLDAVIAGIIDDSGFVGGPRVEAFEEAFASYLGVAHAVGLASGTDAVRIALQMVGVSPGDAVITVSHTFIATAEGALQLGAAPLFVDVDPDSLTLSSTSLQRLLEADCQQIDGEIRHAPTGRRVAAILPVHLYGQSADMAPILELGRSYGIPVVEDAAQAHGATYTFPDGRTARCGSMGDAAAFSFYPGKNLGAMGEAGAVVTPDPERARRARMLRDHGQARKYIHELADGGNARLDAIQAAVLHLKLDRLDDWNARRQATAELYRRGLAEAERDGLLELPAAMPWGGHVYHLFVVHSPERDRLHTELGERGIPTGFHYPVPLHRQPALHNRELAVEPLPVTERAAAQCLSLPMHPHLTDEQAGRVVEAVLEAVTAARV